MVERTYRGLLWALVLTGLLLDLGTKYAVFAWLYKGGQGDEYVVVPSCFEFMAQFSDKIDAGDRPLSALRTVGGPFQPRVNNGALFGLRIFQLLGISNDPKYDNGAFAVVSVLAALAIAYWSTLASTVRDRSLCAALGLILAGTLGNLFDRVVFGGVRDFIHWHYYAWEWPVFNIADCCLVCGACLLLMQAFFARPALSEDAAAEASAARLAADVVTFQHGEPGA